MNQCHPLPLHKLLKGQTFFLEVESVRTQNTAEGPKMVCKKLCVWSVGGGCETLYTASPSFGREIPVFTST